MPEMKDLIRLAKQWLKKLLREILNPPQQQHGQAAPYHPPTQPAYPPPAQPAYQNQNQAYPSYANAAQNAAPVPPPSAPTPVYSQPSSPPSQGIAREELAQVPLAIQRLWQLDANRCVPGRQLRLDFQGATRAHSETDQARYPLFDASSTMELIRSRPTFATFAALLDNYTSQTGQAEIHSGNEVQEQRAFLSAVMSTPPMQYCHQYALARGWLQPQHQSVEGFMGLLSEVWFRLYKRAQANDSSAFEHTFCGEHKSDASGSETVMGMHNWIQFAIEESKGQLDYRGYLPPKRGSTASQNSHVITLQMAWKGVMKPFSTFFIGTSPEFELAIYTLCFLARADTTDVHLDGTQVRIRCHRFPAGPTVKLGSCYPELL